MSKDRYSLHLSNDLIEGVDSFCDEYSLSRSSVVDDMIRNAIEEHGDIESFIEDAVDDPVLELAQKERKEEKLMAKQKLREKKISFEDRCLGMFRKRLEGDAAYRPDEFEAELVEGYREDVEIWFDDDVEIARMHDKVDRWMEWYRMGYWARKHAHTVESEIKADDVEWWFHVGRDIYRLRQHIDDVIDVIETVADRNTGYQSTAVVDAVSAKFTVCEGSVWLLLEHMVEPGDSTIQDALNLGALSGENLSSERPLEGGPSDHVDPAELPEGAGVRNRATGEVVEYIENESDD